MSTPNERLKLARVKLFATAGDAADAMGIPRGTYAGHENGHRGFPARRAATYARWLKVPEEWLLYGKGDSPLNDNPADMAVADITDIWDRIPLRQREHARAVLETFADKRVKRV